MEGLKNRKKRVSSIPKLPENDDIEEIITTVPDFSMNNNDKSLPPLPLSKNNSNTNDSFVELNSNTNKSLISLNTPIKSNPSVSTTPTNVNSLDNFSSKNGNHNDNDNDDGNSNNNNNLNDNDTNNENDNTDGVMNSIFKNFTNYGTVSASQGTSSLTLDNENSNNKTDYDLGDGIKFENENGTEMLSYRRSRRKNNNKPQINTDLNENINNINENNNNIKTHSKSKSLTTPILTNQLKRDFSPIEGSITPNLLNNTTPISMTTPKTTEIDYNLYVDEKYLDTQYRYATEKRNEEFHQLFSNVPETDRLLDDFSCALSREILLQGRIYISEHYLCFNSSLLGWVTTLVISLDEIQKFERRSTVGLFPNGIIIETKEAKHTFANFITRDQTLNFIETIWSKSISLSKKNHEKSRDFEALESKTSFENVNDKNNVKLLTEEDLYTIDSDSESEEEDEDDDEGDYEDDNEEGEDEEEDDDDDEKVENVLKSQIEEKTKINNESEEITSIKSVEKTISKKKKNTFKKQLFPGPKFHKESNYLIDSSQTNVVLDKEFNLPIGLLYEIFFGKDITFHQNMMIMNDGFNFTEYSTFNGVNSERSFEYDKKLNYPIGPKSTRVYCTEKLIHYDLNDYIEILNISKTPNVPSGNAFDCRTKYSIIWGKENRSRLIISFKLEWSGTSWFKSIIESSALAGQKKAANDVNDELLKIIPSKIIEFNLNENEEEREIEEKGEEEIKEIGKIEEVESNKKRKNVFKINKEDKIIKSIKEIIEKEVNKFNDIKILTRQRIETPYGECSISDLIIFIILMIFVGLILIIKILFDNKRLNNLIIEQNILIKELNNKVNELLK